MLPLVVALLVLPASTILVAAPSGGPDGGEAFLTDPSGDPAVSWWEAPSVHAPAPGREPVDLLALLVDETQDHLVFTWRVADLEAEPTHDTTYWIDFVWQESAWWVVCYRWYLGQGKVFCYLGGEAGARLLGVADPATETLSVELPKVYVQDAHGRTLEKGDTLGLVATAAASRLGGPGFMDRAPDEGEAPLTLTVGDAATGALSLSTPQRIRVSNGGATTMVFQAELSNAGDAHLAVDLALEGLPEGWSARIGTPVSAPPGTTPLVLLVSTPFAHEHGGFSNFTLHARSRGDEASHATLRLGVLHTPVPQPAGHHDELYLHPPAPSIWEDLWEPPVWRRVLETTGWYRPPHRPLAMNTHAEHENERATAYPSGEVDGGVHWVIALDPGLRMGLDLRPDENGLLEGALLDATGGEGTLEARLLLVPQAGDDDGVERVREYDLAQARAIGEASAPLSLGAGEPARFSLPVPVAEWADLVPFRPDQNLVLELRWIAQGAAERCCANRLSTQLVAEPFRLKLPLNEYHDPLDGLAEAAGGLQLRAEGPVERAARAGMTLTYGFELRNAGSREARVDIATAGIHASHADVTPAQATLAAGESVRVTLAVRVPAEALDGQALEVLVHAAVAGDPTRTAVARTLTHVGKADDVLDEATAFAAAEAEGQRAVPAPAALALAAVALASIATRRSR